MQCGVSSRPSSSPSSPGQVGDVGLAEDMAHDALVAALEQWPVEGVPDKPTAWLLTVARRRAIDRLRREQTAKRKYIELGRQLTAEQAQVLAAADDALLDEVRERIGEQIGDDLLRLIFIACHPVLSTEARVALTLRLLGWLNHKRDCPGLPRAHIDHCSTHHSGQTDPYRCADSL